MNTLKILQIFNYILGTVLVTSALYYYGTKRKTVPLYIALSVIIAGPVEDYLVSLVQNSPSIPPENKDLHIKIIDNVTSFAFLALLLLATCDTGKFYIKYPGSSGR